VDPDRQVGEDLFQEEEDAGGPGGAVGVVVGVHEHGLAAQPRRDETLRRLVHVVQQRRIRKVRQRPPQEDIRLPGIDDAAVRQHFRRRDGQPVAAGKFMDDAGVG